MKLPASGYLSGTGSMRFAAMLTILFLVLSGVSAWHHEFWRDEMQAWLIVRDLPGIGAILEQAHYEGSPPLWSLMMRPLTWITHQPEIVQGLTWLLAGATIFLFTAFAPFSRLQKLLLVANYYLLFEYGTVCRNYLPGVLALTVACVFYPSSTRRPWVFSGALFFAALASVHSLIVAVAMAAAFWGSRLCAEFRRSKEYQPARPPFFWQPLVGLIFGVALAVYSVLPRADTLYGAAESWNWYWDVERLAKIGWALVYSYFPWPRPAGYFWIPPWDTPFPSFDNRVALGLALVLFVSGLAFFRRHTAALIFYTVGTLGVGAFLYLKYLGFMRHTGFLFIVFLFACWIKRRERGEAAGTARLRPDWVSMLALTAMLAVQGINGAYAVSCDLARPFSCGKDAARYIVEHGMQDAFVAVGPDWAGAPLAGYLNRKVYYPHALKTGSFTRWDRYRRDEISDEEFYLLAAKEAKGAAMVIALDHPLSAEIMKKYGITFLVQLGGSLTPFEDYYLHWVPAKAVVKGPPAF